jgi:NDP-sugar pyrophosphorylase family protein
MVVLCGGRGQRLGALTDQIPKPLLPIAGTPFLLRLLLQWRSEGIKKFILATHYFSDQFKAFARDHSDIGNISVIEEPEPLGTGGGLRHAVKEGVSSDTFFVANGDSYVSQSLKDLWKDHEKDSRSFTLTAVRASHVLGGARQKGCILINEKDELLGFSTEEKVDDGWINGGVYIVSKKEVLSWPSCKKFDLEKEILPDVSTRKVKILRSRGNLLDIGIPVCYSLFDKELGPLDQLFTRVELLKKKISSSSSPK